MKKKRLSIRSMLPKLSLILIIVLVGLGGARILNKPTQTVVDNSFGWKYPVALFPNVGPDDGSTRIAFSSIRDPGGVPRGLPIRLKVPAIGVNSAIEDALITPDGRMDVPAGTTNVAWFALGPNPGDVGSAVIGGHFGIDGGVPRVFYDLDKLVVGDKVYIENDKGETLAFQVRRIQLFDRNADATTVFTSGDGLAHLNLITCEGVWNQVNDTYPERRVIFTDAIASEGSVQSEPRLPTTALTPSTPEPTSKPTSTDTSTTSPTQTSTPTSPSTSSPDIEPSLVQENAFSSINLFDTPLDILITVSLLSLIAFMALKVIKR